MALRKSKPLAPAAMLACLFWIGAPIRSSAQPDPTNVWVLQLRLYAHAVSSPAIAPDGTIYQAIYTGKLLAVTPEGQVKWTFKAGREVTSSPAIGDDGTIYFGSRDWKFYAVSPQGRLKWTFPTGAWVDSSPAIGEDGTIYFGSWDTNFYALRRDGTERWRLHTGGIMESSPVLDTSGNIYLSVNQSNMSIGSDGKKRWGWGTDALIEASPAVTANGEIYFSTTWRSLQAFQQDGHPRWLMYVDTNRDYGNIIASPAVGGDGTIYIAEENCLHAINSTNRLAPLAKSSWPMFRANPRHTGRVGMVKSR